MKESTFIIRVSQTDDRYIVECPELDIVTFGATELDALMNIMRVGLVRIEILKDLESKGNLP